MSFFHRVRTAVSLPLILCLVVTTFPMALPASENISTDQLIDESIAAADRALLLDLMSREETRAQMELLGVNPEEALSRVAALSDSEVRRITGELHTLPAGGDTLGTLIGAALTVFLVLLITDLLCLTTVFSFTRCSR
jgi:hypothetical protein